MGSEMYKELIIELVKNMTDCELLHSLFFIIQKMTGRGF